MFNASKKHQQHGFSSLLKFSDLPGTTAACVLLLALAITSGTQAQVITACDWEVAHPSDPYRVGPGISSGDVDTDRAIAACEQAIAAEPDTARFHYQLGRAQVYAADRAGTDWNVGMPALQKAADGGHVQGMFVLGLMYKRAGDICASEPWTRRAAEAGLKSARISYVNDALAGVLSDCQDVPDANTLTRWLEAARGQVAGFYENMLIDALSRELPATDGVDP